MDLQAMAVLVYSTFPKTPNTIRCLISYQRHLLTRSCPSAEMRSVYSTVLGDWAIQVTRWWGLTPLQKCCQFILLPQVTGLSAFVVTNSWRNFWKWFVIPQGLKICPQAASKYRNISVSNQHLPRRKHFKKNHPSLLIGSL